MVLRDEIYVPSLPDRRATGPRSGGGISLLSSAACCGGWPSTRCWFLGIEYKLRMPYVPTRGPARTISQCHGSGLKRVVASPGARRMVRRPPRNSTHATAGNAMPCKSCNNEPARASIRPSQPVEGSWWAQSLVGVGHVREVSVGAMYSCAWNKLEQVLRAMDPSGGDGPGSFFSHFFFFLPILG